MKINRKVKPNPYHREEYNYPIPEVISVNGVNIHYIVDKRLPVLSIQFRYEIGTKNDPEGKYGLFYLLSVLLNEGAGNYDAFQLNKEFKKIGASFSIKANRESISFNISVLGEYKERAFELLYIILNQPKLEKDSFQREVEKHLINLNQFYSFPSVLSYSIYSFFRNYIPEFKFPGMGFKNSIESIEYSDLLEIYNTKFNDYKYDIFISGDIDADEINELGSKFIKISSLKEVDSKNSDYSDKLSPNKLYILDKPDSEQSELIIGFLCEKRNDINAYPRYILNSIFGGQFSSRLNKIVREEKGFTYGINSSYVNYSHFTDFSVNSSLKVDKTFDTIKIILDQIEDIKTNLKLEEIEFAKSYLSNIYPSTFETNNSKITYLLNKKRYNLPEIGPKYYLDRINATSYDELINEAQNSFKGNIVASVVGDKQAILADTLPKNWEIVEVKYSPEKFLIY